MSSSVFNMQGRQCPRCGAASPMNEGRCRNCGLLFESGPAMGNQGNSGSPFGSNFTPSMPGLNQGGGPGWNQPTNAPASPPDSGASRPQRGQFGPPQWGQSAPAQEPTNANGPWGASANAAPGSGTQGNQAQPQTGSGMQWNQPQPPMGSGQWSQPQTPAGSGTQWNQPQTSMGSGQWGQPQAPAGSGMQWGQPQTPNASTGMQWGQNGMESGSPFAGNQGSERPAGNAIPFSPAPDPFALSEQQKRPPWGMIIGAVVLVLVVIIAGVGGSLIFSHGSNTDANKSTATVNTLKPLSTPTGKPLFADTFANNNNGWHLEKDAKGAFAASLSNGALTLNDNDNKLFSETLPDSKSYGDFQLFVNATLSKGDPNPQSGGGGYGVVIRAATAQNGSLATFYRLELYGDGTYTIFRGQSDAAGTTVLEAKTLVPNAANPAIQPMGKTNQIVVKAKGSTMTFIVNGQAIKTISDASYLSGSIAFFVSNLPNTKPGAEAQFTNLAIFPPQ